MNSAYIRASKPFVPGRAFLNSRQMKTPQNAATIVPVLFRRVLDLHQTTFALGESLAHLHALWQDGALTRHERDGVFWFQAA